MPSTYNERGERASLRRLVTLRTVTRQPQLYSRVKQGGQGADAGLVPRAVRIVRAFVVVLAGIIAGASLYVGFIEAGVIANPFGPRLQGDLQAARGDRPGMRVLFVGNSMTYYHGMPRMV